MSKCLLLVLLALAFPLAAESFYVKDYQVGITVDRAKRLRVEETADLFFTSPSHGLVRDIQFSFGEVKAEVDNISSPDLSGIERSGSYVSVRLGDASKTVTGDWICSLSYDYALPADSYRDYDELYYNIVTGSGWDSGMERVSFSVTFPEAVEKSRIWVTAGAYGSERTLPFQLSEDGLTVSGSYLELPAGWSLTLRAEMDEGYFDVPLSLIGFIIIAASCASALVLALLVLLYVLYGRDDALVSPVRFRPPEGLSPMDTAFLYTGTIGVDAVSAMLLFWGGQGLVSITEDGDGYSFLHLGGLPPAEREQALFKAFFGDSKEADARSLRSRGFPSLLAKVKGAESFWFSGERALCTASSIRAQMLGQKLMSALFILFSLLMVFALRSPLALFLVVPAFMSWQMFSQRLAWPMELFLIAFFTVFMGSASSAALPASLAYLAAMAAGGRLLPHIRKRSPYAHKRMEEAEGYKEFIDKVEKDRIAVLSKEDPGLFYQVLPYAMVFGLAERWCEKFKGLYVPPASWYSGRSPLALGGFGRGFRRSYHDHVVPQGSQSGRPTHRGYSGHAGGGFSGGGGRNW